MQKASDFLKNGKLIIQSDNYSVLKVSKSVSNCFACIIDPNDITVVAKTGSVNSKIIIEEEKDWKILTFDMVLPFELTGFLAVVSKLLADQNIPIFAISAYSTDHVLVKEKDLQKAIDTLAETGITIIN